MTDIAEHGGVYVPTVEEVVAFFKGVEPAKLPYNIFLEAARVLTQATTELIPIRKNPDDGGTEVLLTERPKGVGDPWEGEWHVPGTILFASDEVRNPKDFTDPIARLLGPEGELKSGVRARCVRPLKSAPNVG